MTQTTERRVGALTHQQFTGTIAALQLILLLAALDQTVISAAMPGIVSRLSGFDRYAWVTTAYLLTSTIAIPVFGKLSDSYGRKQLLLAGIFIFALASFFCGMAGAIKVITWDPMTQLIASRALQGLGAGIMLSLCFTVVADITSPLERGRYQGHFAAVFALASVVGPTLGGFIADKFSWRWIFLMNLPLAILSALALSFAFPYMKPKASQLKIDLAGIATFTLAFVPFLLALSWAGNHGWTSTRVLISLSIAVVMLIAFLFSEQRAVEPLLAPRLFRTSIVTISSISLFVTGIGMFGSILLIPLFLQTVFSVSATVSGALLTPLILTVAIGSIFGGHWMSHSGHYKRIVLTGLSLMATGVFLLASVHAPCLPLAIMFYMLIVGAGLGLLLPIYTVVIQNAVPQDLLGAVTGFGQFFRSIGGAVGTAVFGSLMLSCYRRNLAISLPPHIGSITMPILVDPLQITRIRAQLEIALGGELGQHTLVDGILNQMHRALISAIDHVFLLYGFLLLLTLLANVFLPEIPLRRSLASEPTRESVAQSQEPSTTFDH